MKNYEGHLYYYEKKIIKKLKGNRSKINSNVQIN